MTYEEMEEWIVENKVLLAEHIVDWSRKVYEESADEMLLAGIQALVEDFENERV